MDDVAVRSLIVLKEGINDFPARLAETDDAEGASSPP